MIKNEVKNSDKKRNGYEGGVSREDEILNSYNVLTILAQ